MPPVREDEKDKEGAGKDAQATAAAPGRLFSRTGTAVFVAALLIEVPIIIVVVSLLGGSSNDALDDEGAHSYYPPYPGEDAFRVEVQSGLSYGGQTRTVEIRFILNENFPPEKLVQALDKHKPLIKEGLDTVVSAIDLNSPDARNKVKRAVRHFMEERFPGKIQEVIIESFR